MIPDIHIVFDCADPDRLARFWMVALPGYDFPHGPPDGFATWEQWADANQIPQEQRNAGGPWSTSRATVQTSSSSEYQNRSSRRTGSTST
jgi:hypothetical protein